MHDRPSGQIQTALSHRGSSLEIRSDREPAANARGDTETVVWHLSDGLGDIAKCTLESTRRTTLALRISMRGQTRIEDFDSLSAALVRAVDLKAAMVDQGWHDCAVDAAHAVTLRPKPDRRQRELPVPPHRDRRRRR